MKLILLILVFAVSVIGASFAQQALCDYKVDVIANSSEFQSQDFSWRMRATRVEGVSTNITGTAEIQDSKGQIVKSYRPWTNEPISKQKTSSMYSPNLKEGYYRIKAYINVSCEDENKNNNADVKAITIKSSAKESLNTPNQSNSKTNVQTNMQSITYNKKNNTAKNEAINETMNQQTINEKPENTTLDKKEPESLMMDEEDNVIQLRNNNDGIENKLTASVAQEPIIYKSSNEKAKELIVFFLLALSILLNIILIWKR